MSEIFEYNQGMLHISRLGQLTAPTRLLLLHGWGQPAASLLPAVSALTRTHAVLALDLPGNGVAPTPPATWAMADYTAAVAAFMAQEPSMPTIIVCHSFGCRVAMRLAATAPAWLQGIAVLAGHGLRPQRAWHQSVKIKAIIRLSKILGAFDRLFGTAAKARWAARFASPDYKAANPALRAVFQRVIADDVTPLLPRVTVPVLLLYGAHDRETPPAMGQKFNQLLPRARYVLLPHDDHYSILNSAVAATRLKEFVQELTA